VAESPAANNRGDDHECLDEEELMAGLVLRVELHDGDPLAGSIGLYDSDASIAFEGWISFMAAIDQLRRSPCDAAGGQLDQTPE
jgi:hypothetical protein